MASRQYVQVPVNPDRMSFLMGLTGLTEAEDVIARAMVIFDQVVCSTLVDKSRAFIEHRDGTAEEILAT